MTDKTDTKVDGKRRGFLKMAAAAPAAVAATTLAGTETAEAATGPQKGLADTEHTRAYFASARF
ncbi:Tat (twin-arginine translocation) pathway signal sequence [Jannaschia faecimaris]|uniref:Tat (Twin-arginine translocation) pathway signal sequence n=1 Tax=Jannaschia faecimaris TaxID=1244108 RepID=A0A1H3JL56_9RHOB|nr:twin-arginine translocation signal domain-containing protein [Jannaschia faecimaris]SDY40662.1 Tat (twin-arginine translocation) pathway signal sequence [Jannaschia faecimaris]